MKNNRQNLSYFDDFTDTDQSRSGLKKKAVKSAGITIFSQTSSYGIQLVGAVILARLLTPDDFGLITMVASFSMLLQNFGFNGFTEAIIQAETITHEQISTFFWLNVGISTLLAVLFIASAPLISWFYGESRLIPITIAMALTILLAGLSTQHLALLMRKMEFIKTSANQVIGTFLSFTIAIILAYSGWDYWALVMRRVSLPIVTVIGAWILCQWRPGLPRFSREIWPMLKFAINTYGNFMMNYFSRNLDKVLIGWRFGSQSLGSYDRAYYLFVTPVNQLTVPVTSVAIATLSRLRNTPEEYHRYYLKALSIVTFVGMAISIVFTVAGQDIILLLLGPKWTETGMIFTVLGLSIGIYLSYSTHGWLHLSLGRADRWFRWGIFAFIITTLFFIIGLSFGIMGVATAYTTSFYVLFLPGLWYAGTPVHLRLGSIIATIWKYFIAAFTAGLLSWFILYSLSYTSHVFLNLNVFLRIISSCTMCTFFYILFVTALYGNIQPIKDLLSLAHEMLSKKHKK